MNPYESGARKVIPAVLIYIQRGDELLMLHRNKKAGDYHEGKWNGLGGKLEPDESPLEGARRELAEESGLALPDSAFHVLGNLLFPNFKAHKNEDWLVWVIAARVGAETKAWDSGPEGALLWVPREKVLVLNLWEGDRHFIPYVLRGEPFTGTIWYDGPKVTRHWIQPLAMLT